MPERKTKPPAKAPAKRGRPPSKDGAKSPTRAARRKKIAAGIVAGKSVAAIARENGVSRNWASREANSTQTKIVIASMLDKHETEIEELVALALQAIRDHVAPAYKYGKRTVRNGWQARMLAAKRVIEMAVAGRVIDKVTKEQRTVTLEELEMLVRENSAE